MYKKSFAISQEHYSKLLGLFRNCFTKGQLLKMEAEYHVLNYSETRFLFDAFHIVAIRYRHMIYGYGGELNIQNLNLTDKTLETALKAIVNEILGE